MFCITPTNKIILTKGDNAEIDVRVFNKEGSEVRILPSDVITFTLKRSAGSQVLIQKQAELNSIFIYPEDTANLQAGIYVYDVDFVRDSEKQTIIPQNFFEIREEI